MAFKYRKWTEVELNELSESYVKFDKTSDDIASDYNLRESFSRMYNHGLKETIPQDEVIRKLLSQRKKGCLPRIRNA
jgi:hypothetical protein